MKSRLSGRLVALVTMLFLSAVLVRASATPAEKCAAAKNKAAAKKASSTLKCYQKAITTATPVSSTCLTAAEMKFNTAITKAETASGCAITGDGSTLEALVNKQTSDMATFTPAALPMCCSDGFGACWYGTTAADCGHFTVGAANTVCDGATGSCVTAPGAPGNCCSSATGLTTTVPVDCLVGPEQNFTNCSGVGGTTFDAHALCAPVSAAPVSPTGPTCVRF